MLAPTIRVGCSEQHSQHPGTLTQHVTTLTAIALEQAHSLARQGFTVIVLLSTHSGNHAALDTALVQLERSLTGTVACAPQGDIDPDPGSHSGA